MATIRLMGVWTVLFGLLPGAAWAQVGGRIGDPQDIEAEAEISTEPESSNETGDIADDEQAGPGNIAASEEEMEKEEAALEEEGEEFDPAKIKPGKFGPPSEPKLVLAKDPPGMKRLDAEANAWVDMKYKRVVVDGEVCLREGQLEMFACIDGTKEHESIVAVPCRAMVIHAALLAVGAKEGTPVKFQPEYKPATGTTIKIDLVWTDASGVHRAKAQDWIKNIKTNEVMTQNWVFAGSGFDEDEETKVRRYLAEAGDLICVSNFPSAMLDVPVESSQTNAQLLFVANTDAIPPKGTKVRMVLTPVLEAAK